MQNPALLLAVVSLLHASDAGAGGASRGLEHLSPVGVPVFHC